MFKWIPIEFKFLHHNMGWLHCTSYKSRENARNSRNKRKLKVPLRMTHKEQLTVCVCYRNAYTTRVMTTRVMTTPPQKIHLSWAVLLSISLMTVLERPRVFITSRTFLWASYNTKEEMECVVWEPTSCTSSCHTNTVSSKQYSKNVEHVTFLESNIFNIKSYIRSNCVCEQ